MAIDMRETVASAVARALKKAFALGSAIERTETTSGCPMIKLTIANATYNITITRARK